MAQKLQFLFALSVLIASHGLSARADSLDGRCDFDGDGVADQAVIERGRTLRTDVGAGRLDLGERYRRFSCADTDGDGADELIVEKLGRRVSHQVAPRLGRGLSQVCRTTRSLLSGEIYKSIASNHITDQRASSTSFITKRGTLAPRNNCLYAYDKSGRLIHKLGRYFPTGVAYSSRYYGGHGCGDGKRAAFVAQLARQATGSPEIYITSGTGNCARVADANRCYNSSGC